MKKLFAISLLALLGACSHPLEIVGEGDIVSGSGSRDCSLEEFQAAQANCTGNHIVGDYQETYTAEPRAGWVFDRWGNYCVNASDNTCSFDVSGDIVDQLWGQVMAPLQAVFSTFKLSGPVLPESGINLNTGNWSLAAAGYQRAEFFLTGNAVSYTPTLPLPTDGKLELTPNPESTDGDYQTRMVVVRPVDAADFNGTVYVEWLNVSAGGDSPPDWYMAHNEFVRTGAVWVGVSAQSVGVNTLKTTGPNPARYASLSHPGDSYSYDIYSDAGRRVWDSAPLLLDGLVPERVVAVGESQSAIRMVTYINGVHPLDPIYDAFFVHSRFAAGGSISQSPLPDYPYPAPAPIRDDLAVPVMVVMAEGDVIGSNLGARQPDTPLFRLWEMAGTAHADAYTLLGISDPGDGSGAITMFGYLREPNNPLGCISPINAGAQHWILQAAFRALDTWLRTLQDPNVPVIEPPLAPRLSLVSAAPVVLDRDVHGNALGGVRSPHVDAPLATLDSDNNAPPGGFGFCRLFGRTVPFSDAKVLSLYPTKADFLQQWTDSLDANVAGGFLLPEDAADLEAAAEAWDFIPPP